MGWILLSLFIGIAIGAYLKIPGKYKKINGNLQYMGVILLLFFMGVSAGANDKIIKNLYNIGIKAGVFAVLTSLMSIVLVFLLTSIFMKGEIKK